MRMRVNLATRLHGEMKLGNPKPVHRERNEESTITPFSIVQSLRLPSKRHDNMKREKEQINHEKGRDPDGLARNFPAAETGT